ncbi:YkgJ family cysteine cluster protein [Aggregatibacter actinomycetemcomitans]|uniref:YkgJ family cysteine cluster protein n=2 Tax=Aggregatibacter actinomycetemcomitans TaxID=714 RepID=A0AB74N7J9_AGGAC|nr:YkgJ family cysteine cluster protein [Aggregatibacter actinomycetemcomitans]EKX95291.1 hypothetical protein HMPREF9996_01595 [Aggregatibacter actinomycetemcomitans Y4]MBN6061496.1 YkgJ family cysteine cluster protein [Aggregatibacter actinomycetemcomitans]MBN6073052.1 YkgJ family cysteine cluster protein [Aggregatibacter actinomycetemcomitans]OZV16927.1 zinc/iron-chelating domain-containing protein [Aggregatibacter actinomycetemcomitans]PHO21452.1 YkgJ family cysteine cluster protein [Aggre
MSYLKSFPCTACGKCCRNVHLSDQTAYLNRGDGICQHFDTEKNLCKIYENRPLICRVEDYYKAHLSHIYEWDEFVKLNLEICQKL